MELSVKIPSYKSLIMIAKNMIFYMSQVSGWYTEVCLGNLSVNFVEIEFRVGLTLVYLKNIYAVHMKFITEVYKTHIVNQTC